MSEKTSGDTTSQQIQPSGEYKRGDLNKCTMEELRVISKNIGLNAEYVLQGVAKKKKKEALITCIISHIENNKQKTKEVESKKESESDRFMESFECSFCFQTYVDPVTAS